MIRRRIGLICREKRVADDRACTRVTLSNLHGKEGVDGSSPSEGFSKVPVNWHFLVAYLLNTRTHSGHIRGTRDVSRRLATPSDTTLKASQIASIPENPCKQAAAVV